MAELPDFLEEGKYFNILHYLEDMFIDEPVEDDVYPFLNALVGIFLT